MRAPGKTRPVNTAAVQQSIMHVACMSPQRLLFLYNVPRASCTLMRGIAVASGTRKGMCRTNRARRGGGRGRLEKRGGIVFEAIIGDYAYLPGPLCLIKEPRSALLCAPRTSSRGASRQSGASPPLVYRRLEYNFRRARR